MKTENSIELKILKIMLWTYIILCLLIAGLNYGYAGRASEAAAAAITKFWHFYENEMKTLFIIAGSLLTLRIIGKSRRTSMRKRNLLGITISALAIHIVSPRFLQNSELYFFAMPLPWTTTPLQLLYPRSDFYQSRFPVWGAAGISAALIFYVCICVIVLAGSLLLGRRWQCSTLCLFNGFTSEVFSPAFPLIGKKKQASPISLRVFSVMRWIFLGLALFFTVYWILILFGDQLPGSPGLIGKIEIYKYLSSELLMAMFFWIAFSGRGYCYYCPLGTVMSLLGKAAGQKITTGNTKCIRCGRCSRICPMTIDVMNCAQNGTPVISERCVGCGHCVDICPTRTLEYTTAFLGIIRRHKKKL